MNNLETIESVYATFATGDWPAVTAHFAPDIEWRSAEGNPAAPDGAPWIGGAAIVANLFSRFDTHWDGFRIDVEALHDAGAAIVAEVRYRGVFKPTGARVDAQVCHIWRLEGGAVTHFQQYLDTAQMQRAVGYGVTA